MRAEIRFYAGAADAAGTATTTLTGEQLTAVGLLDRLGAQNQTLAVVPARCTLLVNGSAVREPDEPILGSARVDVLPPFAGG
ncbi:MAG: molybdopterin synthase sulfur carrier subunit [Actinobacteria bacterium HGW-Actinobacteria-5]|nr:MAG: molybdopterin synthase sulfur carrier subunit [Actinobacteria bacterium HGW-Actinobacteria-5]